MLFLRSTTSHQNVARRRRRETDNVAIESRKLTILTFVARKTAKTVSDDKSDKRDASSLDNSDSVRENSLLVDTGATAHIFNSKFKMLDCKPKAAPSELGANKACETNGSE